MTSAWELLQRRWPFTAELAELRQLNQSLGLTAADAFSDELRPVFFVGNLDNKPDVLLIGLKPGLNAVSNESFRRERRAIMGTFEMYRESRTGYFVSAGLNRSHYWATAKAVATILGQTFPSEPGVFLNEHAIQAELLPFFQSRAVLNDGDFARVRRESLGGQLAAEILGELLTARPWKAIVVRYAQTRRVLARFYDVEAGDGPASLKVAGRSIPIFELAGGYIADSDIHAITARGTTRRVGRPGASTPSSPRARDVSSMRELEEFVLGLGPAVTALPPRKNGTFVFRCRRNFVTLIPKSGRLQIDVYTAAGWQNGVNVTPGIGIDEAKRLIRAAHLLAS